VRTYAEVFITELIDKSWPDRPPDPADVNPAKVSAVTIALLHDLRCIMIASNGRKFPTAEHVRAQTRARVRRYRARQRAARRAA
jgi:hypothetical protein